MTGAQSTYDDAKAAWKAAYLAPLWENAEAHRAADEFEQSRQWKWDEVRPLLDDAIRLVSPAHVERRVLTLRNPRPARAQGETTTPGINAAFQVLMPGETARPHRHTIDALRFIVEGEGAVTKVDGKDCPMEAGDLVLTPGMTWHEHAHPGARPVVWLDVLNGPLHRFLGTVFFEPGPSNDMPPTIDDAAFAQANFVPVVEAPARGHSPVFRYPYRRALAALEATPLSARGDRRIRYANPLTGGPAVALMDAYLFGLEAGARTKAFSSNANTICHVVEGSGTSRIGAREIVWTAKDVFTIPAGSPVVHYAGSAPCRLFEVSDREVLNRLGLLEERLVED